MSYLISKTAAETTCPRCRRQTLSAIEEGIPCRVDRAPLTTPAAEITALLDGRHTFVLTPRGYLIHRDAGRIAGNTIPGTIHAEHQCTTKAHQLTIDEMIGQAK
ncbi:hypothetical protein ACIBF5_29700 [Micromonospora sp. NPDC050417]|uniref:hypothetical protein n=1 Tax=Micromonospora sp. NPDC050417 TaxID=3364280 RepID=UPI0037934F64